jgi:hypothetical protein
MKRLLVGAAAVALAAGITGAPTAQAEPFCSSVGSYGGCDMNDYAQDGSHTHCDFGWAPFVGQIRNCYWVNTNPAP